MKQAEKINSMQCSGTHTTREGEPGRRDVAVFRKKGRLGMLGILQNWYSLEGLEFLLNWTACKNTEAWKPLNAWIPSIAWIPWIPKTLAPLHFTERVEFLGLLISSEHIIALDCWYPWNPWRPRKAWNPWKAWDPWTLWKAGNTWNS